MTPENTLPTTEGQKPPKQVVHIYKDNDGMYVLAFAVGELMTHTRMTRNEALTVRNMLNSCVFCRMKECPVANDERCVSET